MHHVVIRVVLQHLAVPAASDFFTTRYQYHLIAFVQHEGRCRHQDGRLSRARLSQPLRNARLGMGINGTCRLDEHGDVRVQGDGPSKGHTLALTAGEGTSPLGNLPRKSIIHRGEDVMGVGRLQRGNQPLVLRVSTRRFAEESASLTAGSLNIDHLFVDRTRLDIRSICTQQPGTQSPGEQLSHGTREHHMLTYFIKRVRTYVHPVNVGGVAVVDPRQTRGDTGGFQRRGCNQRGNPAGFDTHAGGAVGQGSTRPVHGGTVRVHGSVPYHRNRLEDTRDLAGAHPRAGAHLDGLRNCANRHAEEDGVAVEREQLAGSHHAVVRQVQASAHHNCGEQGRASRLNGVEQRSRARGPNSRALHEIRLDDVLLVVDVLASDSTQHAQADDGVRRQTRQLPLFLTLGGNPLLQRLDDPRNTKEKQRHSNENKKAKRKRYLEHEHRHHRKGDGRADGVRHEGDGGTDLVAVRGHRGDDIARGHLARDIRAAGKQYPQQTSDRIPCAV